MVPKSGIARETRFRTRAEVQDEIRRKAHSLALRQYVLNKMEDLHQIRDGDGVEHSDIFECLSCGTVTDVGYDDHGALATVIAEGVVDRAALTLVVYVTYATGHPLYVEDLVLSRS